MLGEDRFEERRRLHEAIAGEERRLAGRSADPCAAAVVTQQKPPAADHPHRPGALNSEDRPGAERGGDAVLAGERTLERYQRVRFDPRRGEGQPASQPLGRARDVGAGEPQHRRQPREVVALPGRGHRRAGRGEDVGQRPLAVRPDICRRPLAPPEHPSGGIGHRRSAPGSPAVNSEKKLHRPSAEDNTKPIPKGKAPSARGQGDFPLDNWYWFGIIDGNAGESSFGNNRHGNAA